MRAEDFEIVQENVFAFILDICVYNAQTLHAIFKISTEFEINTENIRGIEFKKLEIRIAAEKETAKIILYG